MNSRLEHDRRCLKCSTNLVDQPIVRSGGGLLFVRCPRCSTCEPAQPYPHLGPSAARWRFYGAFVHVFVCFVLLTSAISSITSVMLVATTEGFDRTDRLLVALVDNWRRENPGRAASLPASDIAAWWEDALTPEERRAMRSQLMGSIEWDELAINFVAIGLSLLFGGLFTLLMPHRRWRELWMATLPFIGLTALAIVLGALFARLAEQSLPGMLALRLFIIPAIIVLSVTCWVMCLIGIVLGRLVARTIVRVFVPPVRRRPLAWLWPEGSKARLRLEGRAT